MSLQELKDTLRLELFGVTESPDLCVSCKLPALPRCYSEAGRREFGISGLCERCFDGITAVPEDTVFTLGPVPHDPQQFEWQSELLPGTDYVMARGVAERKAQENNLDLVDADDLTLQLDLDNTESYRHFIEWGLPTLLKWIGVKRVEKTTSQSGNTHIYIHLYEHMPPVLRTAIQAGLGSDPKRELLNVLANVRGLSNGILLFEVPGREREVLYATDGYEPPQKLLTAGGNTE